MCTIFTIQGLIYSFIHFTVISNLDVIKYDRKSIMNLQYKYLSSDWNRSEYVNIFNIQILLLSSVSSFCFQKGKYKISKWSLDFPP